MPNASTSFIAPLFMAKWKAGIAHLKKRADEPGKSLFGKHFFFVFLDPEVNGVPASSPAIVACQPISSYYGSKAPNPTLYQDLEMTNVCSYGASKAASDQIVRWINGMFGQKVRGNSIALGGVSRGQA